MNILGLTDAHPINANNGEYVFARNVVISNNNVVNEKGTTLEDVVPGEIIGNIIVNESIVIFSVLGINSYIGVFHNGEYNQVQDPNNIINLFTFNRNFPITGEYQFDYEGNLIIAFRDDLNTPKIINIGKLNNPQLKEENLKSTLMFPQAKLSNIDYIVQEDGNLLSGVYYIFYNYSNNDGTKTDYLNLSNVIWITEDSVIEGYNQYDGVQTGVPTNKALNITFNDVDTDYDFINIGLLYKKNNSLEAKIIRKLNITSNLINTVITTYEGETISLVEVLNQNLNYNKIHTLTQLNNRLYAANLETSEEFNMQGFVNSIKLKWRSELVNIVNDLNSSHKVNSHKTFAHNEVYSFYIQFLNDSGKWTKAYHIPGRVKNNNDDNYNVLDNDYSDITETWKKISTIHSVSNISTNVYEGEFGYWENEDEIYPLSDNFPSGKVRHHRFPSINQTHSLHGGSHLSNKWDKLSIVVSNIDIPKEILYKNKLDNSNGYNIVGYRILYAKRTYNNSTTVGYDIALFSSIPTTPPFPAIGEGKNLGEYTAIIQNLCSNALNSKIDGNAQVGTSAYIYSQNIALTNSSGILPKASLRSHCVDLLLDRPELNNLYIIPVKKFRADNTNANCLRYSDWNDNLNTPPTVGIDYTNLITQSNVEWNLYPVVNSNYIPAYTNVSIQDGYWINYYNQSSETFAHLMLKCEDINEFLPSKINYDWFIGGASGGNPKTKIDYEETIYYGIYSFKRNCYNNFYSQELEYLDKIFNITIEGIQNTQEIKGGDCYISDYSYNAIVSTEGAGEYGIDNLQSLRTFHRYLIESTHNLNMRYEGFDINEKYYPKSEGSYLRYMNPFIDFTKFRYDKTYSSSNNLVTSIINNPFIKNINRFPYRIIRSNIANKEIDFQSWKQWKVNDYYESIKNHGYIENIQGFNNNLLIHHQQCLLTTTERLNMETDVTKVVLGSADIFDNPPKEIVSTETGYSGTQNQLSCSLNKLGYCWIDSSMGKIFMFTGNSIEEISNQGLRSFFRDNLKLRKNIIEIKNFSSNAYCEDGVFKIKKSHWDEDTQSYWDVILMGNYDKWINKPDYYEFKEPSNEEYLLVKRRDQQLYTDNPYTYKGYTLAYDEHNNRLLVSKLSSESCEIGQRRTKYYNYVALNATRVGYPVQIIDTQNITLDNDIINVFEFDFPELTKTIGNRTWVLHGASLSFFKSLTQCELLASDSDYTIQLVFDDKSVFTIPKDKNSNETSIYNPAIGINNNHSFWFFLNQNLGKPVRKIRITLNENNHSFFDEVPNQIYIEYQYALTTNWYYNETEVFSPIFDFPDTFTNWSLGLNTIITYDVPYQFMNPIPDSIIGINSPIGKKNGTYQFNSVSEGILYTEEEYFNGTDWQTEPYYNCESFLIKDDLNIKGTWNPYDEEFMRCLNKGDVILHHTSPYYYEVE